jgi:hypothetical protein
MQGKGTQFKTIYQNVLICRRDQQSLKKGIIDCFTAYLNIL